KHSTCTPIFVHLWQSRNKERSALQQEQRAMGTILKVRILFIGLLMPLFLMGQTGPPAHIFGIDSVWEQGAAILQLPSGNIMLAGTAQIDSIGGHEVSLIKMRPDGQIMWTHYFGTEVEDYGLGMSQLDDGALIISGNTFDLTRFQKSALLIKVDTSGQQIWLVQYGDSLRNASFKTVLPTQDGGLLACGAISSPDGNDSYIVKTDSMGQTLWVSAFKDSLIDIAHAAVELPGGDFIIAGDVQQAGLYYNPYLLRLDPQGQQVWQKVLTSPLNGGSQNLILSQDQTHIWLVGESFPQAGEFSFDILLVQLDLNGQELKRSYLGEEEAEAGFRVQENSTGELFIAGYGYNYNTGDTDLIVIKTDANGQEISRRYYGGNRIDHGYDLLLSDQDHFLAAGFSTQGTDNQYLVIRDSIQTPLSTNLEPSLGSSLQFYPNPISAGTVLHINLKSPDISASLTDLRGRILLSQQAFPFSIPSEFESGMYILRIIRGDTILTRKVLIEGR
ncbi:MAG: T9SS type A sorting domain-containing protein, partial [Bacteroidota bacterium]